MANRGECPVMEDVKPFSRKGEGRRRRLRFLSIDDVMALVIRVGGLGTILAVLLVVVVLILNVLPILRSAKLGPFRSIDRPRAIESWIHVASDEYGMLFWIVDRQGGLHAMASSNGALLRSFSNAWSTDPLAKVTCVKASDDSSKVLLGFSDGSICFLQLTLATEVRPLASFPPQIQAELKASDRVEGDSVLHLLGPDRVRTTRLADVQCSGQWRLPDSILALDFVGGHSKLPLEVPGGGNLHANHPSYWMAATSNRIYVQGPWESEQASLRSISFETMGIDATTGIMLGTRGDHALVASPRGDLHRLQIAPSGDPVLVDSLIRDKEPASLCTATCSLLGRETMLLAFENGNIDGFFQTRSSGNTDIEPRLSRVHRIVSQKASSLLAASPFSRIVAKVDREGAGQILYVPTSETIASWRAPKLSSHLFSLGFAPRGDQLIAVDPDQIHVATLDPGFPEVGFRSLFSPIWYEGYSEPKWIWQSSSGVQSSETKLSLVPLLYGTFKATFYAMLVSLPLALFAAIYSSEFAGKRYRHILKPAIEWMSTVPSVVLGFVAAFVLAPILRETIFLFLSFIFIFPFGAFLASHLGLLIPRQWTRFRKESWLPGTLWLPFVCLLGAWSIAGTLEHFLFAMEFKDWLVAKEGRAFGGWCLLVFPIAVASFSLLDAFLGRGWILETQKRDPRVARLLPLLRFSVVCAASLAVTVLLSWSLDKMGWDTRGWMFGAYQDRNAVLVGIMLGFAVIPVVYTLAEDALQSVPQHLRAASLGCGASPWQTTVRVVLPSALGGLFSACMVGLGRAAGETMVVLMAAGNTPLMEFNPFNGFRTLAATLATELPESAAGSTHYRTLFLASLLLFLVTLVANSLAEWVRIRVRRSMYEV